VENPHPPVPAIENVVNHPRFGRSCSSWHPDMLSWLNAPVNISDVPFSVLSPFPSTSVNISDVPFSVPQYQ
jgi:hypothetical protein